MLHEFLCMSDTRLLLILYGISTKRETVKNQGLSKKILSSMVGVIEKVLDLYNNVMDIKHTQSIPDEKEFKEFELKLQHKSLGC